MANATWARASRVLMATAKAQSTTEANAIPNMNPSISGKPKGILAPYPLSPQMKKFLGVSEITRAEAVKKVWEHIKNNNLQNPTNKKEIICDDKLKTIFDGRATVGFVEIMKLMSPHFIKTK